MLVFTGCLDDEDEIVQLKGSGTSSEPYQITSPSDLKEIRKDVTAYFKLMKNLDASEIGNFKPIGEYANQIKKDGAFSGTFDGNGKTINGMKITGTVEKSGKHVGLFGYVGKDGLIKNLKLVVDIEVTGVRGFHAGGLAGTNEGTIENVQVIGNITNKEGQIGGIVGGSYGGIIKDSQFEGNIKGKLYIGGIAGTNSGIIRNSVIQGTVEGKTRTGYVVGYHTSGTIQNIDARATNDIFEAIQNKRTLKFVGEAILVEGKSKIENINLKNIDSE